jgi:hypothetical protein
MQEILHRNSRKLELTYIPKAVCKHEDVNGIVESRGTNTEVLANRSKLIIKNKID